MQKRSGIMVVMAAVVALLALPVQAAEQKVTLMLRGKFCDSYLGEVTDALKKVAGVKDVDLKSMKGHAVVTVDEKAKPDQLATAVNGVKGDGWHCTAKVMK